MDKELLFKRALTDKFCNVCCIFVIYNYPSMSFTGELKMLFDPS